MKWGNEEFEISSVLLVSALLVENGGRIILCCTYIMFLIDRKFSD